MTKEEILAMGVGIELDNAVHQQVMGKGGPTLIHPLPKYSECISAVWPVVEELANDGKHNWLWSIHYAKNWATVDLCCSIGHGRNTGHSIPGVAGKTIPEVICKAALLAKLNL